MAEFAKHIAALTGAGVQCILMKGEETGKFQVDFETLRPARKIERRHFGTEAEARAAMTKFCAPPAF